MEIIDVLEQKGNYCLCQRYIILFDPGLILHPVTKVAYLLSSMDYNHKKASQRRSGEKNLRRIDIEILEHVFSKDRVPAYRRIRLFEL